MAGIITACDETAFKVIAVAEIGYIGNYRGQRLSLVHTLQNSVQPLGDLCA